MFKAISNWMQRAESIRELSGLTDRELADLGIARVDIRSIVDRAQMNRDEVAEVVRPRQTLSRLGGEKTAPVAQTFA